MGGGGGVRVYLLDLVWFDRFITQLELRNGALAAFLLEPLSILERPGRDIIVCWLELQKNEEHAHRAGRLSLQQR